MQIKTNGVIAYTRSEQFPLVVGNDPGREFYERKSFFPRYLCMERRLEAYARAVPS